MTDLQCEALKAVERWRENALYLLDSTPNAVRVHEGGAPEEDLIASIAATWAKMRLTAAALETSWTCFFCSETFTDRAAAKLHFGVDEECTPACRIKASEGGLLKALRDTEEDLFKATCVIHDESGEVLRTWQAVGSRHDAALRSAEESGFEKGMDEQRASIERLRRILARYGDRVPMAMCHRPDWQQEIDEALAFVADNPEPQP